MGKKRREDERGREEFSKRTTKGVRFKGYIIKFNTPLGRMSPNGTCETSTMSAVRSAFGGKSENNCSLRDLPGLDPTRTSDRRARAPSPANIQSKLVDGI